MSSMSTTTSQSKRARVAAYRNPAAALPAVEKALLLLGLDGIGVLTAILIDCCKIEASDHAKKAYKQLSAASRDALGPSSIDS